METFPVSIPLLKSLVSLATVIEAKDPYTGGHIWRVSRYARTLAEAIGLLQEEVFIVHFGSLLHDIGKVSVPDPILNKREKLTNAEYEIIKKHPQTGLMLMRDHPLGALTLDIVASHHERFDGYGYPRGLAGNNISLFARIVSIADAFDAMTSARPYQPGMSVDIAYQLMAKESAKQFDPILLSAFLELGQRGDLDHILGHSSDERLMHSCPVCGPIIVIPSSWQEGDQVICPKCLGNYDVQSDGWDFEITWDKTVNSVWTPQPDLDVINEITVYAPRELRLSSHVLELSSRPL
jgi:putative nucleotidyltransferase with HDIG domain